MADRFVLIICDKAKVHVKLKAGTRTYSTITFTWETSSDLTAELLAERLERVFGDAITAERELQYEKGYRDGQRDARSHRPPTRVTWFSRVF